MSELLLRNRSRTAGASDVSERVLFVISPAGRCGTNFLAYALAALGCGKGSGLPEDHLVFHSQFLLQYADQLAETWSQWLSPEEVCREREALLQAIGDGILRSFGERADGRRWTVLKTPSPHCLGNFPLLFGRSKLLLLVRDGRDVTESSCAAWPGRPVDEWRDAWINGSRLVIDFMRRNEETEGRLWLLVRYEDLVCRPLEAFPRILRFLGFDTASIDLARVADLPVFGSSFLGRNGDLWDWRMAARREDFRPVGRWRRWPVERQRDFVARAAAELQAFAYDCSDPRAAPVS